MFNPSCPTTCPNWGVATTPKTVFAPVLKNTQPRDKITTGTFKLILSPYYGEKKFEPTNFPRGRVSFQSWKVGGWCDAVILKLDYFENIWSDMHSKLCLQVRIVIF